MRTPSRDVYNLFLAQNFLSSVSQHGSSEGTATRRFPKQRSFSRRKERTPAEFDETKCAHNTTVEKVVPSKQVYGAFSPASAQKEASTSSSLLLVNDEASLPLLPVGGYPLDGHVSGAGRTDTGDTDASTHLTRHASCSAAAFVRSSSSVSTSDVEPAGKRAVVKKLRGKKNVEDVLLLRADSSAGPATVLKKGEEVSSSGMQFTFLKRWRAFTKNGRCYFFTHETSVPAVTPTHFPFTRHRDGTHLSTSEERVRRLSCVSADAADIRPIDFRDVQEVSFGRLLLPEGADSVSRGRSPVRTPTRLPLIGSSISESRESALASEDFIGASSVRLANVEEGTERSADESVERGLSSDASERVSICSLPQRSLSDTVLLDYDPNFLFNFESENSLRKTTLKFNGYIDVIFSFCSEEEAKRFLNDKFRSQCPHVQITYSKIKSIEKEMLQIARACDLDNLTLANAYVFYEKVVLKGMVKKTNRKLVAGASLLVATKVNDHGSMRLHSIIDKVEVAFRINRREMLQLEIPLCVALDFNLRATQAELLPHYQRIAFMEL